MSDRFWIWLIWFVVGFLSAWIFDKIRNPAHEHDWVIFGSGDVTSRQCRICGLYQERNAQ